MRVPPPPLLAHRAADPSRQNGEYKEKKNRQVGEALSCMTGRLPAVIFLIIIIIFVRRIY